MARVAAALALLALAAAPAAGAVDRPPAPGRFRAGPLYFNPRFELQLGFDTNVFNTQADPFRDVVAVLRPATSVVLPVGDRLRFTGSGHVDFVYFGDSNSERSVDLGGDGRIDLKLGRFTLFGAGGALRAKQRFSIDLDTRVRRREPWLSAGVAARIGSRVVATLGAGRRRYEFDRAFVGGADIQEALNRESRTKTAELRYELTRQTSFLTQWESGSDDFTSQVGPGQREVRSSRLMAGFSTAEQAVVRGRLLLGVRRFPDIEGTGASPDFTRAAFAINLSTRFRGTGRLTGIVERDVYYGVEAIRGLQDSLRNAYVFSRYRGELALELPYDLIGRFGAGHETADYIRPRPVAGGASIAREERQWTVDGVVLKPFGRRLRVGFAATWLRRNSTVPGNSFEAWRYGMRAELIP